MTDKKMALILGAMVFFATVANTIAWYTDMFYPYSNIVTISGAIVGVVAGFTMGNRK